MKTLNVETKSHNEGTKGKIDETWADHYVNHLCPLCGDVWLCSKPLGDSYTQDCEHLLFSMNLNVKIDEKSLDQWLEDSVSLGGWSALGEDGRVDPDAQAKRLETWDHKTLFETLKETSVSSRLQKLESIEIEGLDILVVQEKSAEFYCENEEGFKRIWGARHHNG